MIWNRIKHWIRGEKLVVYELRKALRKLYEGYPTHVFTGYLHKSIKLQEGINILERDGIIKKVGSEPDNLAKHRLTVEGLKLVESWNMERLVYVGIFLSSVILVLTVWGIWITLKV